MAHTLKLHIWKVLLKPIILNDPDFTNQILFNRILQKEGDVNLDPYQAFFKNYVESFGGKFAKDKKKNKSFAPVYNNIHIFSNRQTICGFLEGGPTGIEQKVKPNSSFELEGERIGEDDVVELDYYFQLWIPKDTNYMYILLQSYSEVNRGIAGPFFEHLETFLRSFDYGWRNKEIKVPSPIKEMFLEESVIVGMDILKQKTNPKLRQRFNPFLVDSENMKFRISVTGLKIPFSIFTKSYKKDKKGNPFFIDLSDMGIIDPNDYIASVQYKDPITKTVVKAELTDLLNVYPTIVLPEYIKKENSQQPDFDKIHKFCNDQLRILKIEDRYQTIDEFAN